MSRNTTRRTRSWIAAVSLLVPMGVVLAAPSHAASPPDNCVPFPPGGATSFTCIYAPPAAPATATYTFDVPAGVTSVDIEAYGGAGATNGPNSGGQGASVKYTLTGLVDADILTLRPGSAGGTPAVFNEGVADGNGDGGTGESVAAVFGGGGGGSTEILKNAAVIIVAAGGGGAGSTAAGGNATATGAEGPAVGGISAGATDGAGGGGAGTVPGAAGAVVGAGGVGGTSGAPAGATFALNPSANGQVIIKYNLAAVDPIAICADPNLPAPAGYEKTVGDAAGPDIVQLGSGNQIFYGLGGNDIIQGGSGNDIICGGDGDDLIEGGSGNDQISGGAGNDSFSDGSGDDTIRGGDGNDVMIENGSGTDDIVL